MSLLHLPTELRHEIYTYLTPGFMHYPFDDSSINAISHGPPPTALQRVCRFLYEDTKAYFYHNSTIYVDEFTATIINDPHALAVWRCIRSVDFTMTWSNDERWLDSCPNSEASIDSEANKPRGWSVCMMREMDTIHFLNNEAKCLKRLVVSVHRSFGGEHVTREMREERLAQLEEVKEGVTFVAGNAWAYKGTPDDELRMLLEKYVDKLNADRA